MDSVEAMKAGTQPVLIASGLSKRYADALVLDRVDLTLYPGEVHALLGENGAGKSTLIKILSGAVRADAGTVFLDGAPVHSANPGEAVAHGIATVYQELAVTPGLSVAENVLLGANTPSRCGLVRWREMNRRARSLFAELGQTIDVRRDVSELSPIGQTMTSLARALALNARILVLDEPTASLTDGETSHLFEMVERMRRRRVAVLYVSHRLDEVFRIAQTFTVLRNGVAVQRGSIRDVTPPSVITAMAGRPVSAVFPERGGERTQHPRVATLRVRGLTGRRIADFDVSVSSGEIVGVAGLAGSGRSEVLRLIGGAQRRSGGEVQLDGAAVPPTVRGAIRAGVILVPQERRADGIFPESVTRNLDILHLRRLSSVGVVAGGRSSSHAQQLREEFQIHCQDLRQNLVTLSGGNQQKVILARYLSVDPSVMLLDEPTRGVDVGTKSEIYRLLRRAVDRGAMAIVVSSELPELLGLCDRVLAIHEGRLVGSYGVEEVNEAELLAACYGRAS